MACCAEITAHSNTTTKKRIHNMLAWLPSRYGLQGKSSPLTSIQWGLKFRYFHITHDVGHSKSPYLGNWISYLVGTKVCLMVFGIAEHAGLIPASIRPSVAEIQLPERGWGLVLSISGAPINSGPHLIDSMTHKTSEFVVSELWHLRFWRYLTKWGCRPGIQATLFYELILWTPTPATVFDGAWWPEL